MKIVEIIPSLEPVGGAEVFVTNFCIELLHRKDIDLKLVVLYKNNEQCYLLKKLKENNVDVLFLNRKGIFDFKAYSKLRSVISLFKPDVIHTHLSSLLSLKLSRVFNNKKSKIVFFHTIHNSNPQSKSTSDKLMYKLIKKKKIQPICVSKLSSKIYSEYYKMKFPYVNNGIDLTEFDSSLPLMKREIDFLCIGRFVDVKNQQYLISIFNENKILQESKVTFIGDGINLERDMQNASQMKNISFIKYMAEPSIVMKNAKILLVPSLNEGNPMVINEAIASGMIVIGNKVGGIPDILSYKPLDYLINVGDKNAFASAMTKALFECKNIDRNIYEKDFVNSLSIRKCVSSYLEVFSND